MSTVQATQAHKRRARQRRAHLIEDLVWLVDSGESHGEALAKRFGMRPESLRTAVWRAVREGDQDAAAVYRRIDWTRS